MVANEEWRMSMRGSGNGGMHTVELLEDALNSTRASTTAHGYVKLVGVRHLCGVEFACEDLSAVRNLVDLQSLGENWFFK